MKLTCTICQNKVNTNTNQMKKLSAKFGSKESVIEKYVCMKCRKKENVRADGKPKPVKRKRNRKLKLDMIGQGGIPEWMTKPAKTTKTEFTDEDLRVSNICWRPDIWAEDKACNNCSYYENRCGCLTKKIVKDIIPNKTKAKKKKTAKRKTQKKS